MARVDKAAVGDDTPVPQAARACFTTSGDGFVVSTREGLRSYQLGQPSPNVSDDDDRCASDSGPAAISSGTGGSTSWVRLPWQQRGAASPSLSWWWRRRAAAVQAVAVAGDSAVIAIVFRTMPRQGQDGNENASSSIVRLPSDNPTIAGATEADGRRYVYLFEDTTGGCLAELYFRGEVVLSVQANTHLLVVATLDNLHIVDLLTLRHLRQQGMYRPSNPHSILALSQLPSPCGNDSELVYRIAFPQSSQRRGDIAVLTIGLPRQTHELDVSEGKRAASEGVGAAGRALVVHQEQLSVAAHYRPVAALTLDARGTLLASASALGSTVKLFDAVTGQLLQQYQRGHLRAAVYALAISPRGTRVAALSSTGTLHLFDCSAVARPRATSACGTSDVAGTATRHGHVLRSIGAEKPRAVVRKVVLVPASSRRGDRQGVAPATVAQEREATLASPVEGWVYMLHYTIDGAYVLAAVLAPTVMPARAASCANDNGDTEAGLLERFSVDGAQEEPEEVYRIVV